MKIALLISTYNWPEALDLVLKSVIIQSKLPDEILIADDGSTFETKELVKSYQKLTKLNIKYFWQEDKGFRKSAILNKAIAGSNSEYIIQVDGDCILHKHFIKDHVSLARENVFLFGSRVNIQKEYLKNLFAHKEVFFTIFSKGIKKRTRALRIPFLASFYKLTRKLSKKLRGCNISFFRIDFMKINGYNEDFEGWGNEDSELACRLLNNGLQGQRIRYKGIVFHIWHQEKSRNRAHLNKEMEKKIQLDKVTFCKNGVNKYLITA